jgi:hypothetical protein
MQARFDRDRPPDGRGPEKRVDSDGVAYTQQEFATFYRGGWQARWAVAKPAKGDDDRRRLTAVLFLDNKWRAADGAITTVYAFDEANGAFRALQLPPKGDTLLLFRADRVLYHVAPAANVPRRTLSAHFLGHYT